MTESMLFAGCILVAVALGAVVIRYRTGLLGLNILNLFAVASATLSGFFFGTVFDLLPDSFSTEHVYVVSYSIAGLLAMVGGIYLGWRPLIRPEHLHQGPGFHDSLPGQFNPQLGLAIFIVGMVAEFGGGLVHGIPTVSTAFYCLSALGRLGLFILLIDALGTGRWNRFLIALAVFGIASIVGSLTSGFSFIRINALIPLMVIWYAFRGFTFKSLLVVLPTIGLMTALVTGWLETRNLIRGGSLEGLSLLDQATTFFREFAANLGPPDASSIMSTILERVDMTDILAEQVSHQPAYEPYAYGETVLSSFYTLIPRFLWADKPEVAGGSEFVTRFSGIIRQWDDTTSVGLPYPFELYANGGAILVVVGLGLIGYIAARMELSLFRAQKSLGGFLACALVTIVLCEGGQRTDVVLPALVASALTAYALGWLIEKVWGLGKLNPNPSTTSEFRSDRLGWRPPPR